MKKLMNIILMIGLTIPTILISNTTHQVGSVISLTNVIYAGSTNFADIVSKGKYGLGTIDNAVGELIIVNGVGYLSDVTGEATILKKNTKITFADVFSFKNPHYYKKKTYLNKKSLLDKYIKKLESGENYYYAIKLSGSFKSIQARTIPPLKKGILLNEWIQKNKNPIN
jgi:acetolactate decarboxylase